MLVVKATVRVTFTTILILHHIDIVAILFIFFLFTFKMIWLGVFLVIVLVAMILPHLDECKDNNKLGITVMIACFVYSFAVMCFSYEFVSTVKQELS